MRRGAAALAALALIAALLTAGGGWPSGRAGAASTTCVWVKHTKRVVKHVKRHGKVTRVVHFKHYRTCRKVAVPEPTPTTTAPTTTTPAPVAPDETTPTPPSEPAPPEPKPNALGVSAYDQGGYRYELSHPSVHSGIHAGQLTLQLVNAGEDPHSMDMQKIGAGGPEGEIIEIPVVKAGGQSDPRSINVEAGTYRMWCTLGHHAEEGMEAEIEVE
jgi:hypothetical protein